jgi:hypothetical protein
MQSSSSALMGMPTLLQAAAVASSASALHKRQVVDLFLSRQPLEFGSSYESFKTERSEQFALSFGDAKRQA